MLFFCSGDDQVTKKHLQKHYLNVNGKAFCIAQLQDYDKNTLVHNHTIPPNHGKFLIKTVFARRAANWDGYDPDIHCPGSYVIWAHKNTSVFKDVTTPANSSSTATPCQQSDAKNRTEITDGTPTTQSCNSQTSNETPILRRKRKPNSNLSEVRERKMGKLLRDDDEFLLLNDAVEESEQLSDEELEFVILPPDNVDGETDTEIGNDVELSETLTLDKVQEVSGTIELCTSKKATTTKKKPKKPFQLKNRKKKIEKEKAKIKQTHLNNELHLNNKIDDLIESAEEITDTINWKTDNKEPKPDNFLSWKSSISNENQKSFDKLNEICQGKMPVEIFELLFNEEMRQHIIGETLKYAQAQNDSSFSMTEYDLKCYVGTMFLSGYHSLPQQSLYWERSSDVDSPTVYQCISKNKFRSIKKYTHLADNNSLDKYDKYAKVRPLYDITNKNLQQFGYWHLNYSIDEQMIPYFGMHSAKQTMRNKSIRFGYKNFVLASSDGYPYLLVPYAGAKGIGGTPGKDLTVRVVTELVLKCYKGIGNLTFDNWFSSAKLLNLLTALDIPTICTARTDRIALAPVMSNKAMEKQNRGHYNHVYDDEVGLHCLKWFDNAVVTLLSNSCGPFPLATVERFSRKQKKKISVPRPNVVKLYNESMGGVDLVDSAVATYRIKIRGKKWWWPHFTNTLGVIMGAAWKIYRATNPDENGTLLHFVRSVVQSYLHVEKIVHAPSPNFWNAKKVVDKNTRLTGRSHWPTQIEKQRRCQYPGCSAKPRIVCEECDVALCIKSGHFKLYHITS